jgi:hypothetical protein
VKSASASRKPDAFSLRQAASRLGVGSALEASSRTVMWGGNTSPTSSVSESAVQFTKAGNPRASSCSPKTTVLSSMVRVASSLLPRVVGSRPFQNSNS